MNYLKSLEKLGLNQNEQNVYFALLQLEKATANEIASKSRVKRPTTYDILYRLQNEGFIYEIEDENKRKFIAHSPEKLVEILNDRKREVQFDLPFLTSLYNRKAKKPKVAYFEGLEGIKKLYEDTLLSCVKGDEILSYVSNETVEYLDEYTTDYVKRRSVKGIIMRGIYEDSPGIKKYLKYDKEHLRISKVARKKNFDMKNEINIYANKMIILTYSPEPFGVLIESQEIADTQRTIFEMAWRGI